MSAVGLSRSGPINHSEAVPIRGDRVCSQSERLDMKRVKAAFGRACIY